VSFLDRDLNREASGLSLKRLKNGHLFNAGFGFGHHSDDASDYPPNIRRGRRIMNYSLGSLIREQQPAPAVTEPRYVSKKKKQPRPMPEQQRQVDEMQASMALRAATMQRWVEKARRVGTRFAKGRHPSWLEWENAKTIPGGVYLWCPVRSIGYVSSQDLRIDSPFEWLCVAVKMIVTRTLYLTDDGYLTPHSDDSRVSSKFALCGADLDEKSIQETMQSLNYYRED
jgi:hypothetical protein